MDAGSSSYKCPACGAGLSFSIESQDFHCIYCGSHFTKDKLDAPMEQATEEASPYGRDEDALRDEEERRKFGDENRLYMCPSCGAAVMTDTELDASAECYYCHSPIVLSGRLSGEYRPDLIIPFKKTRGEAIMQFQEWTKGKRFFLAKGFGSADSLQKIQGIYIPFWLADCCVEGKMSAECFKTLSSVRHGDYIVTTEAKSAAVRDGSVIYNGIPADGSSLADDALMDSIEPFDYSELVKFDISYLSGHSAQRYDVTKDMVMPRINNRVQEESEKIFRESITGYSRVNVLDKQFGITNINWKHAMLPMWFLTFKYKEKLYYFAMNGQTGKYGGILPINKGKLALFSFGLPLIAALILALLAAFMGVDL